MNPLGGGAAYYILAADIDLTGVDWKPIGNSTTQFGETFNGGGHVISGLNSINSSGDNGSGFFGYTTYDATIRNLGLKVGNLTCDSDVLYFGALVGYAFSDTIIDSCYVTGTGINGSTVTTDTGGLVGTGAPQISNCYTNLTVEGKQNTGGLVGYVNTYSNISNCFAAGDVIYSGSLAQNVGGLFGLCSTPTSINNNVALNTRLINAQGSTGNLYFVGMGVEETSYYNKNIYSPEGSSYSDVGVYSLPVNPYTMGQSTPPFNNWNFVEDWKWDDSINQPVLRKVKR